MKKKEGKKMVCNTKCDYWFAYFTYLMEEK